MRRCGRTRRAALALLLCVVAASGAQADALRRAEDGFAGRVLGAVGRTGNVVLSPYSISEALAMLAPAARGRTAVELRSTLGVRQSAASLSRAFGTRNASLAGVDGPGATVSVANSLWGQQAYPFRAPFLAALASGFRAPLQRVDFMRAARPAVRRIDDWVASRTVGRITELLGPADVDSATRLVLVNAIYLNAWWASPFRHSMTTAETFHAVGGNERVATMHQDEHRFLYARGRGYTEAELPYLGHRLAFDVILPEASRAGLSSVLSIVRRRGPSSLVRGLHPVVLSLALPKLLLRTRLALARPLRRLGLVRLFDPWEADLSGAGGRPGALFVSAVVHEAFLQVDEAGTEAAAATGVGLSTTALIESTPFVVDRPFVFLLRDRKTGSVLFAGVVRRI